ncbi:MAG: hypothetical protein Q9198_000173 [Flavoplaca austrocitrina]
MAAAPSFASHPGAMAGHAGMAPGGHPMAPGHPSHQGIPGGGQQPGMAMGQQMHGGVMVPGGQQGHGMMGGMMPGGGPAGTSGNGGPSMQAHALSHLAPGHAYAQQQAMANNPQMAAAHQQAVQNQRQIAYAQAQAQMQMQARQQMAQNGGMPLGHGNNPMHTAQYRANQGNPNIRPPGSMPNQLQQQQQQQQQQQALMNREQQQQQQQQQHAQQQQQQQHMAQQMAIQQAATQAGSSQPQPAPQQQSRPPSQMAGGQDPQSVNNAQQHAQMQQQQSQTPQQSSQQPQAVQQAQQQPPPPPQQQQQQQQPPPQATPQQQTQQPPQAQPQQQPNQQSQTQQQHQVQQQAQQMHNAQQQAAAAMMQPRLQNPMKGASVLKLIHFGDQLGNFSTRKQNNDLNFWVTFVERFFSHTGVIRQQLYHPADQSTKKYEISPTPTLARFYWTHFNSGVQNIQMIVERFREVDLPNGGHSVASEKTSFIYWLANGHQLVTSGQLRVQFNQIDKIDVLEILTTSHEEFVPRAQLLRAATESPEMKHSPNQSKATGKKAAQQRQKQAHTAQEQGPKAAVPSSIINDQGVTPSVQQFLEVAEAMSLMQPLFRFSQSQPGLSPTEALHQYTATIQEQSHFVGQQMPQGFNPAIHQQQQNIAANLQLPPGQRTPNHFVSPANSVHLNLPGQMNGVPSPATLHGMSPAIQNLALQQQHQSMQQQQQAPTSVGMVHSASQPGTNNSVGTGSQGPSANASPNMTNKRRRASAVKGEDDGAGTVDLNVGPAKGKSTPRIGGKRQKGAGQ